MNRGAMKVTRKKTQLDMREAEVQIPCSFQTSLCPISFLECAGFLFSNPMEVWVDKLTVDKLTMLCDFTPKKIIKKDIVR